MPNVIIIAGPNGAGKSTLAPALLRDTLGITQYVNADTLAEGLSAFDPAKVAFEAGRVMLRHLRIIADEGSDFAFETTLASRSYAPWLRKLKEEGYTIGLIFLWLEHPDLAVERVKARVRAGGHDIAEATIRRRYERGIINLFDLYLPLVDHWQVFDNTSREPQLISSKIGSTETIVDEDVWRRLKK